MNAVKTVFPSTRVQLCDVHWKRNLRKKIQDVKLQGFHDNPEGDLQDFVRLIWTVAMVPPSDVQWYWTHIVLPSKPELQDDEPQHDFFERAINTFLSYIEKTYIGVTDANGKLRKPRYEPEDWNKFESIKACEAITTNKSEVSMAVNYQFQQQIMTDI